MSETSREASVSYRRDWREQERVHALYLERRELELEAAYRRRDAKRREDYYTSYLLPSARVVAELIARDRPHRFDAWLLDMVQAFGMEQEPVPEESIVRRDTELRWLSRKLQTFDLFMRDLCEYPELRERFGFESTPDWWKQSEGECAARREAKK